MTRIVMAAFFLLLAAPASAQWGSTADSASAISPYTAALDASDRASATEQHRVGAGLIGAGLTLNLVGAVGAFVGLIGSISVEEPACLAAPGGSCRAPQRTFDYGAFFAASVITSFAGLAMFFIGLGLDIHAHVIRGRLQDPSVALDARGLTITF